MREKIAQLLLIICVVSGLLFAQTSDVLTNRDVLDMLKAGLSGEIVEAKIKASTCKFDTSPETLKALKQANVPDRLILAMVQAESGGAIPKAIPASSDAGQAVQQETPDEITVYVTRTGKKYHRDGCSYLSKSKVPMSLSQAGEYYTPCSVCHPPQMTGGTPQGETTQPPAATAYQSRYLSSTGTYQPKTVYVRGYYRKNGTYVRPYTRRSRR